MKISINWLLDHIVTPVSTLDVGFIVAKFNVHTAEIESYEKFQLDIQNLFLGRILSIDQNSISVRCDELRTTIQIPYRNDLQMSKFVLIRRHGNAFSWETLQQYSATKEGLFPAVDCPEDQVSGGWKQHCEVTDYILDVDNKSINHRPDLWGHRGIAREVAAFMGWQLKPLDQMLAVIPQVTGENQLSAGTDCSLNLEITDMTICPRIAALYCQNVRHKASSIWMAMRLARIESKPINTIIDITNYVMFDISQPMHVFDAAHFSDKNLVVRRALATEKLELLDGHQVSLTDQDIVLTDGKNPVALAGVMGGKQASFGSSARAIIIEAGSFQAAMVRNSATRVKVVSESSTRFAKQIDPMQNTTALLRFVALAQGLGVVGSVQEKLVSIGKVIEPSVIVIAHSFIENRLGIKLSSQQIITNLEKLEFQVHFVTQGSDTIYQVVVPTLRTTKDITIPEDIVEEIARLYGFENIVYQRPIRQMKSFDISPVMRLRKIKEHCAFAMNMTEVRDYLFYDESFLKRLGWYPTDAVALKNPVSENWKVLVTSLIPHLIKNVELNYHSHEQLNFFENNRIWHEVSKEHATEHTSLAGIFFGHKSMSFYDYKAQLQQLFAMLDFPIVWVKCSGIIEPWFDGLQAADIMLDGIKIGRAGMFAAPFVRSVIKGSGFIFELNSDLLLSYKVAAKKFVPWSKYQSVAVDVSILVDMLIAAEHLENLILQADKKIDQVRLLDCFEKEEWVGKRSLTFRYRISDFEQNLTKEIIESITHKVTIIMEKQGATIRL